MITDKTKLPTIPDTKFTPSQAKLVRLGDGTVVAMNRAERRKRKLYGDRVTKVSK